jgi:hypothetical protein
MSNVATEPRKPASAPSVGTLDSGTARMIRMTKPIRTTTQYRAIAAATS